MSKVRNDCNGDGWDVGWIHFMKANIVGYFAIFGMSYYLDKSNRTSFPPYMVFSHTCNHCDGNG